MDSVSFLNSLLDKIDSSSSSSKDGGNGLHHTAAATISAAHKPIVVREQLNKDSNSDVNMIKDNTLHLALPHRSNWFEYYDSASGKRYYHDRISNTTTWDKPTDFEKYFTHNRFSPITINNTPLSSSSSSLSSSSLPSSANKNVDVDYRVVGTFNKITGRFTNAGPESYWDKVGRPNDKSGRQLAAFMDLNELEANREEAKAMKEMARRNGGQGVDWARINQEKKDRKRKAQFADI